MTHARPGAAETQMGEVGVLKDGRSGERRRGSCIAEIMPAGLFAWFGHRCRMTEL
jgi:hypothetical protein